MFEKLLHELKQLEKTKSISVPISSDKDGYIDKECPNKDCLFVFKVDEKDWKEKFKDENVFCPLCGYSAESQKWWTTEQIKESKNQIKKHIVGRIDAAMVQSAKDFNAKQPKNSFISMSLSVSGTRPQHSIMPVSSIEEMQLKIQCKRCNAKYAVIGCAFFCPCCGHNSVEETLDQSLKKIDDKIKHIPNIKNVISEINKDEAETTCRSIIETGLGECVVAFQRFCEVIYSQRSTNSKTKPNAFQNLDIGSEYWKSLVGETYEDWLTEDELKRIKILFQKRHLLAHTEGIVDAKYIEKSCDKNYSIGQRIVIKEKDVLELLSLVQKLVSIIKIKTAT